MVKYLRGMTLVDVIIGASLFLIIFLALATTLRTSAALSTVTKAQIGADTLLASQMEYIRSLSYASIGTKTGTPSGVLDATATSTSNGVIYTLSTVVTYIDDSHDGTGAQDGNGIVNDYKVVTLTATYESHGAHTEELVGTFIPPHTETSGTGGALQVRVVNTAGNAVSGASVHVTNASVSPAVDVSAFSNSKGTALFSGMKAGAGYQVQVSSAGYTSAQTSARTTANENPTIGYLTVAPNETTASTFVIDAVSTLTLRTQNADLSAKPNSTLTLSGVRTLGTSASGVPVYANTTTATTNALGTVTVSLPWDIYSISATGYTIASSSQSLPYQLLPGANATIDLTLTP